MIQFVNAKIPPKNGEIETVPLNGIQFSEVPYTIFKNSSNISIMIPVFYAFLTALATIGGGMLPRLKIFQKIDFRYLVGFSAGAMIAIAFFDIFPEIERSEETALWIAIGFFSVYLVEKFLLLHTCNEKECEQHALGWPSMIGVAAESIVDGIAIAVGYSINEALGIGIAIAVIAHEIPRGFTTTVIMKNAGKGMKSVWIALLIDGGFTPIGALFASNVPEKYFMNILAFVAGTFLYIGAADLLPEAHKKFNRNVIISVMFGVILIYVVTELAHAI